MSAPAEVDTGTASQDHRTRHKGKNWMLGGAAVIGFHIAAGAFFSSADPYETQVFLPCPWNQLTGLYCPMCGATRALYSLLHGDIAHAFMMNPLIFAFYAAGALFVGQSMLESVRGRALLWPLRLAMAIIVAAGLYTGVLRNLLQITLN